MPRAYGMYTEAGDRAVERLVNRVVNSLKTNALNIEIYAALREGMRDIAVKYDEVWDTEVRTAIIAQLERDTGRNLTISF